MDFVNGTLLRVPDPGMLATIPLNLVFFMIGIHFSKLSRAVSILSHPVVVVIAVLAAGVLSLVTYYEVREVPVLYASLLLIVPVIALAKWAADHYPVERFAAYLGPRTLPIFLIQFPVLALAREVFGTHETPFFDNHVLQLVFPVLVTLLLTVLSLVVYQAVQRNNWKHIFQAPGFVTGKRNSRATQAAARQERGAVQVQLG